MLQPVIDTAQFHLGGSTLWCDQVSTQRSCLLPHSLDQICHGFQSGLEGAFGAVLAECGRQDLALGSQPSRTECMSGVPQTAHFYLSCGFAQNGATKTLVNS
jgi:hypothetical protein